MGFYMIYIWKNEDGSLQASSQAQNIPANVEAWELVLPGFYCEWGELVCSITPRSEEVAE